MRARKIGVATLRAAVFAGLVAATLGGLGVAGARITASQGELGYTPQDATPAADAWPLAAARTPRPGTFVVAVVLGTSPRTRPTRWGPTRCSHAPRGSRSTPSLPTPDPLPSKERRRSCWTTRSPTSPPTPAHTRRRRRTGRRRPRRRRRGGHPRLGRRTARRGRTRPQRVRRRPAHGRDRTPRRPYRHQPLVETVRPPRSHPETRWVAGERFVRDDTITTTAGITSGIPGALSVMQDLEVLEEARTIGAQVGYPG